MVIEHFTPNSKLKQCRKLISCWIYCPEWIVTVRCTLDMNTCIVRHIHRCWPWRFRGYVYYSNSKRINGNMLRLAGKESRLIGHTYHRTEVSLNTTDYQSTVPSVFATKPPCLAGWMIVGKGSSGGAQFN